MSFLLDLKYFYKILHYYGVFHFDYKERKSQDYNA